MTDDDVTWWVRIPPGYTTIKLAHAFRVPVAAGTVCGRAPGTLVRPATETDSRCVTCTDVLIKAERG